MNGLHRQDSRISANQNYGKGEVCKNLTAHHFNNIIRRWNLKASNDMYCVYKEGRQDYICPFKGNGASPIAETSGQLHTRAQVNCQQRHPRQLQKTYL